MTPELSLLPFSPIEIPYIEEPSIPVKIGRCINPVSRRIGQTEPCSNTVLDTDSDAIEVPGGILCGPCVNKLLSPRPVIDLEDKAVKKRSHKNPDRQPGPRRVFL